MNTSLRNPAMPVSKMIDEFEKVEALPNFYVVGDKITRVNTYAELKASLLAEVGNPVVTLRLYDNYGLELMEDVETPYGPGWKVVAGIHFCGMLR